MGKSKKAKKDKKVKSKEAKLDKKLALWVATFKEQMVSMLLGDYILSDQWLLTTGVM